MCANISCPHRPKAWHLTKINCTNWWRGWEALGHVWFATRSSPTTQTAFLLVSQLISKSTTRNLALIGQAAGANHWWAWYHSTRVFSHFTALILPRTSDHVNASRVTNVTGPYPTHSNIIQSIPMKITFGPAIIRFYRTLLLHRCPAIAKSQGRKTSSNFIHRNPSFPSPSMHWRSKTARPRQQNRTGISSALAIWNYHVVTWSADDPNMVTLLLDFVHASPVI
jgi:hypothetical protein